MKRFVSILFWSAISAAFIGPGTVTTAARAGASHGMALIWALVFSTIVCLALQEASARLTITSKKTLGECLASSGTGWALAAVVAVVIGCAAYEAGNILGAVSGAQLASTASRRFWTGACGLLLAVLLLIGAPKRLAHFLGLVVAIMGVAFAACALLLRPDPLGVIQGTFVPTLPAGSSGLVLGLIGTTVVPYNLFLGSSLARGQDLSDARTALAIAIPFGGLISIAVLVVGTAVQGDFSFEAIRMALSGPLGARAGVIFAVGLFAAGFSSALTAPLAAGLAVQSVAPLRASTARYVALAVLGFGLFIGWFDFKPIPVILLAQALNGLLLPLIGTFLLIAVNDPRLVGTHVNGWIANTVMGTGVLVTFVLGARALVRAAISATGLRSVSETVPLVIALTFAGLVLVRVWIHLTKLRR